MRKTYDKNDTIREERSMDAPPLQIPQPQPQQQPQWFYFGLLLAFLIGVLYLLTYGLDIASVSNNWADNRCKPQIIPFASLYGYNTAENFQYCMKNIIRDQAGNSLGPVYQILATFVGTISTLIQSANSLRLSLATLVGGVTSVFQEFSERLNTLMTRIRISSLRMKMLFGRLFATFYSVIFMGMSGITAVSNFGDTFLFKFLDTFCFDPDTEVEVLINGEIKSVAVKDVKIGDVFAKTGSRVTATFQFYADGQPMVTLPNETEPILVSTNHYVKMAKGAVQAGDHPDAKPAPAWNGGLARPLICFNTHDHTIPIGGYQFLDYDETEAGDEQTMIRLEEIVNGARNQTKYPSNLQYSPGFAASTEIALPNGEFMVATKIKLGQQISTGKVVSIIEKEVDSFVKIGNEFITASSLVWNKDKWVRTFELGEVLHSKHVAYSFIVSPTATIETRQGTHIRDYMEVMSPDAELEYTKQIHTLFSEGSQA